MPDKVTAATPKAEPVPTDFKALYNEELRRRIEAEKVTLIERHRAEAAINAFKVAVINLLGRM